MVIRYTRESSDTTDARIFRGRIIHSKSRNDLEMIHDGLLGVDGHGKIVYLTHDSTILAGLQSYFASEGYDKVTVIELKPSQFLFPGMIDTHLHAPQWENLALGMDGKLEEWLHDWTDPTEASFRDAEKARRVYPDVVKTTLRLGTTTVAYHSTIHLEATNILADTCHQLGQRAIVGKMAITKNGTQGNSDTSLEASLADTLAAINHILHLDPTGHNLRPCVMPRGGPYCPPDLLSGLGTLTTKHKAYVQAHMSESPTDVARTLALHAPLKSYPEVYSAHNLLTRRTILAHSIHLTPSDITAIANAGAGVAQCPNSNVTLRSGLCHVRALLDAGVRVGLGTDCSAGYMPSMLDAMRAANAVARTVAMRGGDDGTVGKGRERDVLEFEELVWLCTLGGAEVLDWDGEIGNFEVGKEFDALVVDVDGVVSMDERLWVEKTREDDEALVKKWVFLGDDRTIRKVFVGGILVAGHDLEQ